MLISCNQAISLMRSFIPVLGIKDFQFLDMAVNLIDGGALINNMLLLSTLATLIKHQLPSIGYNDDFCV